MKILVAGGCGYVGSVLVPILCSSGYDVTVIDLCWFSNYVDPRAKLVKKDLFTCTEEDFKEVDVAIFIAGVSNDPSSEFDFQRSFIYNAALPPYLAFIAKRAGVKRYIYASTASVYGFTYDKLLDETSEISSNYAYGISKYAAECGIMHLRDDKFSVICLRKGTISGVSKTRMRFDLLVNTMVKTALVDGTITITNPALWRPLLALKDAVYGGYMRAVQAHPACHGIFNLAYSNYTLGEVADIVKDTVEQRTGRSIKLIIKNVDDLRNYKISTEKAKTILGFHPRFSVESIVHDILDNWHLFESDILADKYYNINVCKKLFKNALNIS